MREVFFGMEDAVDVPQGLEAGFAKARFDFLCDFVVGLLGFDIDGKGVQARRVEGGV